MKKFIGLLVLLGMSAVVNTANAEMYVTSSDKYHVYILKDTIKEYPNASFVGSFSLGKTFWTKWVIHTATQQDSLGVGDYEMQKITILCTSDQIKVDETYKYRKGTLIDSVTFSGSYIFSQGGFKNIVPNTLSSDLHKAVCKK